MLRRSSLLFGLCALLTFFLLLAVPLSKDAKESVSLQSSRLGSWYSDSVSGSGSDSNTTSTSAAAAAPHATTSPQLNYTKVATMIETRLQPMLIPILKSWLANVPSDWPFVIWTGPENHDTLSRAACLQADIASGRLNLTRIDSPGSSYQPDPTKTSTLSDFLCNTNWFWRQFHPAADWMIFFQADSVLCSTSAMSVDDWIGYDFVGGPSPWSHGPGMDRYGGNGGLSMRRISSALNLTTQTPRKPDEDPEDVWFTRHLKEMNGTRWPELEGMPSEKFSISGGWIEDKSHAAAWMPLGIHHGLGFIGDVFEPDATGRLTDQLHRVIQSCPEFLYLRYAMDEYKDLEVRTSSHPSPSTPAATPSPSSLSPKQETTVSPPTTAPTDVSVARISDLAPTANEILGTIQVSSNEDTKNEFQLSHPIFESVLPVAQGDLQVLPEAKEFSS